MVAEVKEHRFESVFRSTYRDVLAFSIRRTDQPADAADVVGETFAIAWRRFDDIPAGLERAWLFGVARKVMANQRRGDDRRAALGERLTKAIEVEAEDAAGVSPTDETGPVAKAFAGLSARDREVLALLAWEGLDVGEVAVALGIGRVAARSRIHRARGRLRKALEMAGAADAADEPSPKGVSALISAPEAASGKGVK